MSTVYTGHWVSHWGEVAFVSPPRFCALGKVLIFCSSCTSSVPQDDWHLHKHHISLKYPFNCRQKYTWLIVVDVWTFTDKISRKRWQKWGWFVIFFSYVFFKMWNIPLKAELDDNNNTSDNRISRKFLHTTQHVSICKINLFNLVYLAVLPWQPRPSVTTGHHSQLRCEHWCSPFPVSQLHHRKPHATLFIIQPTSVCNSYPVLLLASHGEVTSLCTSTTALAFQHGSRTAAQQNSALLKSQRGPDQSRAGREPGSGPSRARQLRAAYNKWETMRN